MSGEGLAQFGALLVAELCEEGIVDDMVGGAEIVDALLSAQMVSSAGTREKTGNSVRRRGELRLRAESCGGSSWNAPTYLSVANAVYDRSHWE